MTLPAPTENSTYLEPPPRLGIRLGSGRSHRLDRRVTPGVFQRVHLLRRWPRLKPALDARHRYRPLPPSGAPSYLRLPDFAWLLRAHLVSFPATSQTVHSASSRSAPLTGEAIPATQVPYRSSIPWSPLSQPCPISPRFDIQPTARPGIIDTRLGSPPTHPECPGYPLHLPCSRRLEPRVFKYPTILPRATVLHLRNESPSSIAASLNRIGSRIAPARP
ncbi:hypothetical protein HYQ44_020018 [Verticillium longisporum]|nr:hypothetical protein HYQ44_020018 [Verticillium longisporum]